MVTDLSGRTKVCALIGHPVEHSLSPAIQNAAFRHLGLDYVYVAFNVKPENLSYALLGVRSLGIHGLNVTMPHKVEVIRYLDNLDENARLIGSVNTILNSGGRLIGYTTDGVGALNALKYSGEEPANKKIVVLGAGGASRSISFTLAKCARELVILNRTVEKAEKLAKDIISSLNMGADAVRFGRLDSSHLEVELRDADIVINATSIGMKPNDAETPIKRELLHGGLTVFDIVYEPLETRLLREAKIAGAKTIDGLSMLIHQGAASFEIWTGVKAPIEVMREAALK
ncbi:MAG: shikimate dehydrogenase, partial [Candidatus Bathyarchaeota archaeon]|nr:shikimate dehydrogenase [Candidatus Bathyarchaeota archaeon]